MKFSKEKKKDIVSYLLEKIAQKEESVAKTVSEVFSVNQNTIHTYINELMAAKVIKRVRRGQYELISQIFTYDLKRKNGDLDTDTYAYDRCLYRHICDFPLNVRQIWNYAFSEMINNVMDHSMAENVHIVVKQDLLGTGVAIVDDGIGIFKKIQDYFGFSTAEEAMCELFKGKLTTDSANHTGEGIFFASKMMDEFFIYSDGNIFTNNKYDSSGVTDSVNLNAKGTCVIMFLSNDTRRKAHEIFDLYADVDGGFIRTKIPIKNIFDTSPVSRSQAKRVSNRLEKFQEVEIDFQDVSWMGQGFAHQLFVVFAGEHPEIMLNPINMNEDITKMYHHVLAS